MKEKLSPYLFSHEIRKPWEDVFLKYNTPLPSSMLVERLFSFWSDVLRPKRSVLSSPYFQQLVFMKSNFNIRTFRRRRWRRGNRNSSIERS